MIRIQVWNFLCGIFLSVSAFGGVGGVSGGTAAAIPEHITVQVCGNSEDSGRCEWIKIRNYPESHFGQGPSMDCVKYFGDIQEAVACDEETKRELPKFFKKLWKKNVIPYQNNSEGTPQ